jgi:hypothetical protein
MKEIGIGLIGFGMMGKTHSYAYRNLPLYYRELPFRIRLVGVCSGHLANAEKARTDLGYTFATDDYRDILSRPDIDAVNICTPAPACEAVWLDRGSGCDKPGSARRSCWHLFLTVYGLSICGSRPRSRPADRRKEIGRSSV